MVETEGGPRHRTADNKDQPQAWLLGGQKVRPENRSLILEVIVRVLFHTIIVVSLYLLFAGHNLPGGGFAGGLVAGIALAVRYLAGGRDELLEAVPFDAGKLLGGGMVRVNNEPETRRGRQLVNGDVVTVASQSARVSDGSTPDDFPW